MLELDPRKQTRDPRDTASAGTRAGILLDLHPDGQVAALHHEIRAAVHDVRGPASTDYPVLPAHLTESYCREECDSDGVQSQLRRTARPRHAPLTVGSVQILEVSPDHQSKQILWDRPGAVEIRLAPRA